MSRGKGKSEYKRKSFETRIVGKPADTHEKYVGLCLTMLMSDAYANLSDGAKNLYVYMRLQYDGKNEDGFCFNRGLWFKTYKLYKNPNSFYKHREELINQGFIRIKESGRNTRTKSIYAFSDEWQNIAGRIKKRDLSRALEANNKRRNKEQ